jgi:ferredoxin
MKSLLIVDECLCDGCGTCIAVCPEDAILMPGDLIEIDSDKCDLCMNCLVICPVKALRVDNS